MKSIRLLPIFLVLMTAVTVVSAQSLTTVYSHDFERPVGPEWSTNLRSTTPIGLRTFLGRFSAEGITLDLGPLPEHCSVTVSFELFVIGTWEGSVGWDAGADLFDVNASTPGDCCPVANLLHATFANCECKFQSYPETYPDVHLPGLTGADEVDTLGYDLDSVYDLELTFFHDQPELRLTFAGSRNLQGVPDESWGIDNIVVSIDNESCCRATRELPPVFAAGERVPVTIEVTPQPRAEAYVVEEDVPYDFNAFNINDGGVFDGELIKWGPYFDDTPRTLTYTVRVANWVADPITFDGTISVDGTSEPICGDTMIVPGTTHPADMDGDSLLEADEFTAYAAAWRRGEPWPVPPSPISADLVSNAGVLWKSGEAYVFDGALDPPYAPASGFKAGGGTVTSSLGSLSFAPGQAVNVTLQVVPQAGTLATLVEERLPEGWAISDLGGAQYDASTRTLKFGPFFDSSPRAITYRLTHLGGPAQASALTGAASFNGVGVQVAGARLLLPATVQVRPVAAD